MQTICTQISNIQKKLKDPTDKTPQSLVNLITEKKTNKLMNLLFNVRLEIVNAILENDTMRKDLLNALEITELQNNIALLNKGVFEGRNEAKSEYELEHDDSETCSDDSEYENEEETE